MESEDPNPAPPESEPSGRKLRISLNAPFVLVFAGISLVAMIIATLTRGEATGYFLELPGQFEPKSFGFYFKLLFHPVGHAAWAHYFGNFTIILLVGPLLEEKYGTVFLTAASILTAVITGLAHVLFFNSGLIGASGVAFMMILLTSMANFKENTIPLTFIIVAVLFMGREIASSLRDDHISQFAHIIGGLCGAAIGFWWGNRQLTKRQRRQPTA